MMQRRNFLATLVGVGTGSAITRAHRAQERGDAFEYRGWQVRWSGWRYPTNQDVRLGFWSARQPYRNGFLYSTTTGHVDTAPSEFSVIWTDRGDPATPLSAFESEDAFEQAKMTARDRLLREIDKFH